MAMSEILYPAQAEKDSFIYSHPVSSPVEHKVQFGSLCYGSYREMERTTKRELDQKNGKLVLEGKVNRIIYTFSKESKRRCPITVFKST